MALRFDVILVSLKYILGKIGQNLDQQFYIWLCGGILIGSQK